MIELSMNTKQSIRLKYTGKVRASRNTAKMEMLNSAFERLLTNNPIVLPRGSAITKSNVAIEAGLPRSAVNEKQKYQEKLISKINFVRAIDEIREFKTESNHPILKPKAKNLKQQDTLKKLYLALNRIIDNKPINIPKDSPITQGNVSLEAGYGASHLTTRNPLFTEICVDIRKAKIEQDFQNNKVKTLANMKTLGGIAAALREALGRLERNTPQIIRKGLPINIQNVSIEAGLDKDFLKTNQVEFKSLISNIEDMEIKRQSEEFIQAIERLNEGEPKRIDYRNIKLDIHVVAVEAGYPKNYLECYKTLFSDVIKLITFKKAKTFS